MSKVIRKVYLLSALFFALVLLVLTPMSCGGGGGGGLKITPTPNTGTNQPGSSNDNITRPDENNGELTVNAPEVAKTAGEVGGVVLDAEGNAIDDLELYLDSVNNFVGSTDEEGKFLISGVDTGTHEVIIGLEGEDVAKFSVNYTGSAPLNTVLAPSNVRVTSQEGQAGRLVGRVTDLEDNPIAGVKVLVFDRSGFFLLRRTGELGFYEFEAIPAGNYFLIGFKRGYRTHVGQVSIEAGKTTEYNFQMARLNTGGVRGIVTDSERHPIAEAHVFLLYRERHSDASRPPAFHTMTNGDGFYAFEGVPAGPADMLVFKPEYLPADAEVVIPPNEMIVKNFVLFPHEPPPPRFSSLSGKVFAYGNDASSPGEPIPGARIQLRRPDVEFEAFTDQEGFYHFVEIPSGGYGFRVSAEGFQTVEGEIFLEPGENHRDFFLRRNEQHEWGRIEGVVFWGESDDPVAGALVELWRQNSDGTMQKTRTTQTNEHGAFVFEEVAPGLVVLKAFKEDATGAVEAQVPPGETVRVNIRIFRENHFGMIKGTVFAGEPNGGGQGVPVPGAVVKLFRGEADPNRPPIRVTETDGNGYYQFGELEPSGDFPYWIIAEKVIEDQHWRGAVDGINLGSGEVKIVDIFMHSVDGPPPPEYGAIGGVIWREIEGREEFVVGALVLLFRGEPGENNPPIRETRSGDQGWYHFGDVPPSGDLPYFVVAKKEFDSGWWFGHSDGFFLRAGEEKRVDVRLYPPEPNPENGKVCGSVWRIFENGEEVLPNALVLLYKGDPSRGEVIRETRTGEDGWYTFEDVPPSGDVPYVVVAKWWDHEERLWKGMEDFHLAPGEEREVHIQVFLQQDGGGA